MRWGIGSLECERRVRILASEVREWCSWRRRGVLVEGGRVRVRRVLSDKRSMEMRWSL